MGARDANLRNRSLFKYLMRTVEELNIFNIEYHLELSYLTES